MGLPLATEPLDPSHPDEVGYRIPREQYELPDPGLDEDELAALRLAAAAVQLEGAWGRDATVRALRKLAGAATGDTGAAGPARGRPPHPAPARARPGWPPCPAGTWSPPPSGPSRPAGGSGSATAARPGWWTRGGCRSGAASGTWPAWTTAGARSACSASTASAGPLTVEGPPGAFARPAPGAAGPPPPWRLGDDEETSGRAAGRRRAGPVGRRRPRGGCGRRAGVPTARSCSRSAVTDVGRLPVLRARASSTTPRSWAPRICATTWWSGWPPGQPTPGRSLAGLTASQSPLAGRPPPPSPSSPRPGRG